MAVPLRRMREGKGPAIKGKKITFVNLTKKPGLRRFVIKTPFMPDRLGLVHVWNVVGIFIIGEG